MAKVDFREMMAEDRRLQVLLALDQAQEYNLNEHVIKTALALIGHNVGADVVRAEIIWLEQHQLVRLEKLPTQNGELWIASLMEKGQMVARGRFFPGVRKPDAN